jgi:hypothetical protein
VTVRDYDREEHGTGLVKPYGVRDRDGKRYVILQVWDFAGDIYDLAMYFVVDDGGWQPETHVMRSKYYAIGTNRLMELMRWAGFASVERLDGKFYQPVLVGTREGVRRPVKGGSGDHGWAVNNCGNGREAAASRIARSMLSGTRRRVATAGFTLIRKTAAIGAVESAFWNLPLPCSFDPFRIR